MLHSSFPPSSSSFSFIRSSTSSLHPPPRLAQSPSSSSMFCFIFFSISSSLLLLLFPSPVWSFSSPCQLPSPVSSKLSHFCQFPYHQVPFICDPGGILSRTEAELIDRRLRPILNLTSCICPSRPCSQQDRRNGQFRAIALLVPMANIDGIRKCTKGGAANSQSWETKKQPPITTSRTSTTELASATGQFARMALERLLLGPSTSKERCDPDLLLLYIDQWEGQASDEDGKRGRQPFVARIFRRNLATLRDHSLVERVHLADASSPFEILLEQLGRAIGLANPHISYDFRNAPSPAISPSASKIDLPPSVPPAGGSAAFSPPAGGRTEPIPFWAIACALGLLSMALLALILAHWFGQRISLVNQKKFSTASRMSTRSTRTEEMSLQGGGGGGGGSKGIGGVGASLRGTVTFGVAGSGGGASSSASHLKSQMMFRQFSRKTQASVRMGQNQKI